MDGPDRTGYVNGAMTTPAAPLPTPPTALTPSVADLVRDVLGGRIRIPTFQRGWKWDSVQVRDLLDSLYRGYPVGSLLMWKRREPSAVFKVGSRTITAEARDDALAVVDGQQRLTALVGTLAHPAQQSDPEDPFAVWFDPESDLFQGAPRSGALPEVWVPVDKILDANVLQDWIFERPLFQQRKDLRQKVFAAGTRIRDYRVPMYVVETTEWSIPQEIFRRSNRSGREMEEADVMQALLSEKERPARLDDLQQQASELGMGEVKRHKLLQCVMAVRGLNVTRRLDDQPGLDQRLPDLKGALADTAPALGSALAFLRNQGRIPHLDLLPYYTPLIVLTRFFFIHPDPGSRCRELLTRWIWRGMLSRLHEHNERTRLRDAVRAVQPGDPESSATRLLQTVPREPPREPWWMEVRFDGRSAGSRIAGLWLAFLEPRSIEDGTLIDISGTFDRLGSEAFRTLAPGGHGIDLRDSRSAANRIIQDGPLSRARLRALARSDAQQADTILASHGLDGPCKQALAGGSWAQVISARRDRMRDGIASLGHRLAAWGQNDRPSIRYLLQVEEEEAV